MSDLHIPHRRLAESVRHLILREIDDMCYPQRMDHAVHDLRVSGKRIRAWLRLLRDAIGDDVYRRESAIIRDLGRLFSRRRDSRVVVATLDALEKSGAAPFASKGTASVRRRLETEAEAAERAVPLADALSQVRDALFPARRRLERLRLKDAHPKTAFRRIWKRARKARARALKTRHTEALHEWRKAAKALYYQLEALKDIWPGRIKRLRKQLKAQGDLLGQDHDLAVLFENLEDEAQREVVTARRHALQAEALDSSQHVYQASPKRIGRKLHAHWKKWRKAKTA